jgi:hypothetical protein
MLPLFVQPRRSLAYTSAPLQNLEHEAYAFDLGDDADVCFVASSSAVVAAGHGCGRDGLKPLGRRTFWSGWEVDDDYPKPSWHRSMRHGKVLGDGGASASTEPAGQTSDKAVGKPQLLGATNRRLVGVSRIQERARKSGANKSTTKCQ